MTRRRLLTAGAAGLGALIAGDQGREVASPEFHPFARARARVVVPRIGAHPPRSRPEPPPPLPVPPRDEAIARVHDLLPGAPPNAVALTIDDGPQPDWTPKMLDLLAEHQVKATF